MEKRIYAIVLPASGVTLVITSVGFGRQIRIQKSQNHTSIYLPNVLRSNTYFNM